MNRTLVRAALAWAAVMTGGALHAHAQEWTVDLSAGQTVFESVSANVSTNSLIGSVRYDARRAGWIYGALAAPLRREEPFWGASGLGGRLTLARSDTGRLSAGIDAGAHGYAFRDPVADVNGTGGTLELMPFTRLALGTGHAEMRIGWRGHALDYGGTANRRGVLEAGARASHGTRVRVSGDARVVRSPEGTFPFVGGSFGYTALPLSAWLQAGRWLGDTLSDVAWSAGAAFAVTPGVSVWTSVRQEATDPLYWNSARRSWSVGITTRLGRPSYLPLQAPRQERGRIVFRVPVSDVPNVSELWIAGSFNEWQPTRMERQGSAWVLRLPLAPGIYHYAFRTGAGEWLVPPSVPGRRDDGMGGHVAVVVVS